MQFDTRLNTVSMVLPTDRPYADAIAAAGYHFFPHYCATHHHTHRVFAFAVFHVEHTLHCFITAGSKGQFDATHFGGVPLLYARHDTPDRLVTRLQQLCPS